MSRRGIVERALELAASGKVRGLTEIRGLLSKENYTQAEITSHLSGLGIKRQIADLIRSAGKN